MDTCIVETGLLRKKPCGHAAITKCVNCEAPLCAQHAVPQLSPTQKKTGASLCKECDLARREYDKLQAAAAAAKSAQAKPQAAAPAKPPAAAPAKAAPPAAASEPIPDTIEYRPEPKKK